MLVLLEWTVGRRSTCKTPGGAGGGSKSQRKGRWMISICVRMSMVSLIRTGLFVVVAAVLASSGFLLGDAEPGDDKRCAITYVVASG